MNRTDRLHWNKLWHALRAQGDPELWHRRLLAAYGESSRHYHTLEHLGECLLELDAHRASATDAAVVEAALWFHDAVYDTYSALNEEDSAALAVECFAAANVATETIERIRHLILCTKAHDPGDEPDGALLVDIDLAIFGHPPERFWVYDAAIRAEYAWVPAEKFARRRSEILAGFLQRPTIYRTAALRTKYEATARENLREAIARLQTEVN